MATFTPVQYKAFTGDMRSQFRKGLLSEANGVLYEHWQYGYFVCLKHITDPGVSIYFSCGKRPIQVLWWTCGDRKVNGKLKADRWIRSRSFSKPESVIKFIQEIAS